MAGIPLKTARNRFGLVASPLKQPMHIIATFFTGLVVGTIAKLLNAWPGPGWVHITGLLEIGGGQQIGWYGSEDAAGFLASAGGALLLLPVYRLFCHRPTAS